VVTCNRRQLLLEALAAVHAQSRAPDAVIVVDNASADGTAAAVRRHHPSVRLAELTRNTGGAGGFACGAALALAGGADLIWFMDDDTVPGPGALRALLAARERYPGHPPALVASRVLWTDRRAPPMNTLRRKPFASQAERLAAAAAGCQPIRSASFVSILVDAGVCRRRGLPRADYFLWNDDFEFTARLLRGNTGLLCPASVVVHNTAAFGSTDSDPGSAFSTRSGTRSGCSGIPPRSPPSSGWRTPARRCAAGPVPSWAHATGARSGPHFWRASPPGSGRARGRPRRCSRIPARPGQSAAMPAAPAGTRVITAGSWYRQENS
jgi:rhamnopyranosyl-N-acetylglucosaminyl-diphospho-decaprenol beta-1,3/1,4-galactofuranosyltransferase